MLFLHHERLNPSDRISISEAEVIAQRREDPVLADDPITSFATVNYRPQYW